nr:hypothetical protein [Candidatus Methylobacter oryzae]
MKIGVLKMTAVNTIKYIPKKIFRMVIQRVILYRLMLLYVMPDNAKLIADIIERLFSILHYLPLEEVSYSR